MGRPYTMRELKQIVDYLVEHRHYGEVRGRKMWMDLANTHKIERTWQSLKETFLKRILTDIHNPYYKLTVEQIASFRREADITGKHMNKLEIQTIIDSSSSNTADQKRDNEQPSTSKALPENKTSGEDKQCEKISSVNRSSTDTLVLETCGVEANEEAQDAETKSSKSFRDLITYSEPLTPMLQEVLHDFDSDDDPQMQIVEDNEDVPERPRSPSPLQIRQSRSMRNDIQKSPLKLTPNIKTSEANKSPRSQPAKIKSLKLKKTHKGTWEKGSGNFSDKDQKSKPETIVKTNKTSDNVTKIINTKGDASTTGQNNLPINCSNASTDTPIPNNQEALNKSKQLANQESQAATVNGDLKRSISPLTGPNRKRSKDNSIDTSSEVQIIKISEGNVIPITDTPSQHDSSKENIPNSNNEQQKDKTDVNTKSINIISKEIVETDKQREAGPSVKSEANDTSADKNPCLNSVSLFAEQFSNVRYSGSESEEEAIKSKAKNVEVNLKSHDASVENKVNKIQEKENNHKTKEIDNAKKKTSEDRIPQKNVEGKEAIFISETLHGEPGNDNMPAGNPVTVAVTGFINSTDSDFEKPKRKRSISEGRIYQKTQREKALANVFGFSSGAVRKRGKQHCIIKHHGKRRYSKAIEESSSSDQSMMSESDNSPSPQRKNYHNRKYIKPKPYHILSQTDGALFTIEGKRVYPIVRQDKQCMKFAELLETHEEHEELYWKKRYEEEKLRADELAKLLERQKRPSLSPILQTKAVLNSTTVHDQQNRTKENEKPKECGLKITDETKAELRQDNAVKIKFNKENEIEVECQFPHVDPLLEKMAKMFHMNVAPSKKEPEKVIEIESGMSTPVVTMPRDPEVAGIIEKKESEIFKQIQVLDELEQNKEVPADNNVTKRRRGRPRNKSVISPTTSKKPVTNKGRAASADKIRGNVRKAAYPKSPAKSDVVPFNSTRKTRTPMKLEKDAKTAKHNKVPNASLTGKSISSTKVEVPVDDSQVRYKFPNSREIRSSNRTRTASKRNAGLSSYTKGDPKMWSSPDINNANSVESSLGYQDSDASLESEPLRRRKRYPSSFYRKHESRKQLRRKSYPYLADDDTYETIPSSSRGARNGTRDTEVYRSESYQLLGVQKQNDFISTNIVNINANKNDVTNYKRKSNVQTFTVHDDNVSATLHVDLSHSLRTEEGNSSNVSLPLSPELSVVENISVSKEVLKRVEEEQPTLNETTGNENVEPFSDCNKYMMSDIDVSLPLMEQDCGIHAEKQSYIDTLDPENYALSESLDGKICTVNIKEQSSSDALAVKLKKLLLESAKKISQKIQADEDHDDEKAMEVDTTAKKVKKPRVSKKRCSTPHKRLAYNAKGSAEPILEEHLETCSYSGRKSCPPAIKIFPCDNDNVFTLDENDNNNSVLDAVNTNRRGRKKKDIIKVKITRPKRDKSYLSKKDALHSSRKSVCTDSGINDESDFLHFCDDDSIELIHNHSDTCLQANECLGDSIEFIQNKTKSIISVDSDSIAYDNVEVNDTGDKELLPEFFCNYAQDAAHSNTVRHEASEKGSNVNTVYFTPPSQDSANSLITEDLSDEIAPDSRPVRPGKWYICSDEETTTFPEEESPATGISANLKQIFTLVCAVPNLSTISEASKENDSRKATLDTED